MPQGPAFFRYSGVPPVSLRKQLEGEHAEEVGQYYATIHSLQAIPVRIKAPDGTMAIGTHQALSLSAMTGESGGDGQSRGRRFVVMGQNMGWTATDKGIVWTFLASMACSVGLHVFSVT